MTEENGAQPAGGQVFSIEKIYLKDAIETSVIAATTAWLSATWATY